MKIVQFEWLSATSDKHPTCRMTLEARGLFIFNKIYYSVEGTFTQWFWSDYKTNSPAHRGKPVERDVQVYFDAIYNAQLMSMKAAQREPYARSKVKHNTVLDTFDVQFSNLSFQQYMELSDLLSVVPNIETHDRLHILGVVGHADAQYRKHKDRKKK